MKPQKPKAGFFTRWFKRLVWFSFIVAITTLSVLLVMYYRDTHSIPRTAAMLEDFGRYSKVKLRLAGSRVQNEWNKIDWSGISAESKSLWESTKDKMAALQKKITGSGEAKPGPTTGATTQGAGSTVQTGVPAGPQLTPDQARAQAIYKDALVEYKSAMEEYRQSFPGQAEAKQHLRKAADGFHRAQELLQAATDLDPENHDIKSTFQDVQEFIYDCVKRS